MALAESLPEPASTPADPETGGTLAIDLAAVEANWRALARQLVTVECAAVVKANAYGLGLEAGHRASSPRPAARRSSWPISPKRGACAPARARPRSTCSMDFRPTAATAFIEIGARPVINSTTELAEWDAFVAARNWRGGAALHVDTGMNRLGISVEEAAALAPRVQTDNHGITLLMSHLACAEIADHPLNATPDRAVSRRPPAVPRRSRLARQFLRIFLGDSAHCDLARPGAALYGINPTPGRPNPMRSVVELTGRILQVRNVDRGETVGYGATWTARRASRIAVAALGYADGLLRAASGTDRERGGMAIIAGKPCPFAGRISMDLVCIDITDLPDGIVHRGDVATFIGAGISVDDIAASAGTIGYEILTRLGPRCHLVYRGG